MNNSANEPNYDDGHPRMVLPISAVLIRDHKGTTYCNGIVDRDGRLVVETESNSYGPHPLDAIDISHRVNCYDDLLAACEESTRYLDPMASGKLHSQAMYKLLTAAIAKAKGGAS